MMISDPSARSRTSNPGESPKVRNLLQKETEIADRRDKPTDEYNYSMDFELTPCKDSEHSDSVPFIGEISMRDHPVSSLRFVNLISLEPTKRDTAALSAPPKRFCRTWRDRPAAISNTTDRAVQQTVMMPTEPMKEGTQSDLPPPRRFYKSFWRGLAKRATELYRDVE
jgi:hypothetical protein